MQLIFNVAKLLYRIDFKEAEAPYKQLIPTHAPFLHHEKVDDKDIVFTINVETGSVPTTLAGLELVGEFDCGNCLHTVARRAEGGYRMLIHNVGGELAADFESDATFQHCNVTTFGSISNQRFGLDNSIMIAFAFSAAYHKVLLMHSSVPVKDGRGYLFQGKSGTGKSTHCELWLKHIPDTERINDDNPVVRIMDDGSPWVFGSPWSGKTPIYKQVGYPIGGFLRLHQTPHNKIRKLTKIESFASILSSCSTMIWDKPSYFAICDTVNLVAKSVGCFDLECLPDKDAALLSYTTMSQDHEQH